MTDVPDMMHLIKLGDWYYFRRRVPQRLRPVLGRQFIKKGLGVTTIAEARKLRAIEEVRADTLFAAAENGLAGQGVGTAAQPVAMSIVEAHVREAVDRLDKRSAQRLMDDPPADATERAEMRDNVAAGA